MTSKCILGPNGGFPRRTLLIGRPRRPTMRGEGYVSPGTNNKQCGRPVGGPSVAWILNAGGRTPNMTVGKRLHLRSQKHAPRPADSYTAPRGMVWTREDTSGVGAARQRRPRDRPLAEHVRPSSRRRRTPASRSPRRWCSASAEGSARLRPASQLAHQFPRACSTLASAPVVPQPVARDCRAAGLARQTARPGGGEGRRGGARTQQEGPASNGVNEHGHAGHRNEPSGAAATG